MSILNFYDAPNYGDANDSPECLNLFLAGPILGATDWQSRAKQLIVDCIERDFNGDFPPLNVWNPRRPEFFDQKDFSDDTFYEQVDWEHTQLERAQFRGIRMFWLCNKTIDIPRNYALTTLFELGEALGQTADLKSQKIVVGIEDGFTNQKYLEYTLKKKTPIFTATTVNTLEGAVRVSLLNLNSQWLIGDIPEL